MGPWDGAGWVLGIALPTPPSHTPPRVHLPPAPWYREADARAAGQEEYGRGAHIRPSTLFMPAFLRVP